jgi:hypothetical protein
VPAAAAAAAAAARRSARVVGRAVLDVPTDRDPLGIVVSAEGQVCVVQNGTHTIGVFAADDYQRLRSLGEGRRGAGERKLSGPTDVALSADGALLYIADYWNHRVTVWWSADCAQLRSIGGREGSGPGPL